MNWTLFGSGIVIKWFGFQMVHFIAIKWFKVDLKSNGHSKIGLVFK
jgi:hypothetical protein